MDEVSELIGFARKDQRVPQRVADKFVQFCKDKKEAIQPTIMQQKPSDSHNPRKFHSKD